VITVLTGANDVTRQARLGELVAGAEAEYIDAADMTAGELRSHLLAQHLFVTERCIVLENASQQKEAWQAIGETIADLDASTTLLVHEPSLDKRSKTYKTLQKHATIEVFDRIPQAQLARIRQWTDAYAAGQHCTLTPAQRDRMCERALVADAAPGKFVYDQGLLIQAIDALAPLDVVTDEAIDAVLPPAPHANVFELFRLIVMAPDEALTLCQELRHTEEPYMVLALLGGQLQQLAALTLGRAATDTVAQDIGAHPFALGRLEPLARAMSVERLRQLVELFARADDLSKSTATAPWQLIETLIHEIRDTS